MITVLQRVSEAWVSVDDVEIARIDQGLMVLVGIQRDDTEDVVVKMAKKLISYRVFSDDNGKMNLSLQQIKGGLLLVPQFTLAAQTNKGMRPGFSAAASPQKGQELFDMFVKQCGIMYDSVCQGEFGADMDVGLVNDGPVTFVFNMNA